MACKDLYGEVTLSSLSWETPSVGHCGLLAFWTLVDYPPPQGGCGELAPSNMGVAWCLLFVHLVA